jgi:serine/threonine protein kinase
MNSSLLQGSFLGKYAILHPIGRGGMSQVYKGYHQQLDRFVAIKVLRSDLVEEAEFLSRFKREARSVAALQHSHIVQIYDFDVQDQLFYMVMELLEGDSLKALQIAYRNISTKLPIEISIKILLDVLSALEYAHNEGVIHRDLKPANIILNSKGQAILTDFGIAQIVGGPHYTISGAIMGTLSYMAPEQGLNNQCDFRSDIYSIGIIAYELLTGQVPFEASTPVAVLMKHINDPLPKPSIYNPHIPPEIEAIVLKSFAKKPEERYQKSRDLADALKLAAKNCYIDIPDTIIIPKKLIETKLTNNKTVVFSGNTRKSIPDIDITNDKTITSNSSKLNMLTAKDDLKVYSSKQTTLVAITIIIFANICMLWVGGIYGWKVLLYSWPMELAGASLIMAFFMASKASPWFLIPTGILLGNALLLASSTLTGHWGIWVYTWPIEVFLISASIILPFFLARKGNLGRLISQKMGIFLTYFSGFALSMILIISTILVILK